jgi:hypothetical protein
LRFDKYCQEQMMPFWWAVAALSAVVLAQMPNCNLRGCARGGPACGSQDGPCTMCVTSALDPDGYCEPPGPGPNPPPPPVPPYNPCGGSCGAMNPCEPGYGCPVCGSQGTCRPHYPSCGRLCTTDKDCKYGICSVCSANSSHPNGFCFTHQPTPLPTGVCGSSCFVDEDCHVHDSQVKCRKCSPNTGKCEPVSPSCGDYCTQSSDCHWDPKQCGFCDQGDNTCKSWAHTPQPPSRCGWSCTKNSDCAGGPYGTCTFCFNGQCGQKPSCGQSCIMNEECGAEYICMTCTANFQFNLTNGTCVKGSPKNLCYQSCKKDVDCGWPSGQCPTCYKGECRSARGCGVVCYQDSDCKGDTCVKCRGVKGNDNGWCAN